MGTIAYKCKSGIELTVEFSTSGSNESPSYSPMYGADGGDSAEVCINYAYFSDSEGLSSDLHLSGYLAEKIEAYIFETYEFDDDYYYDDYDPAEFM